MTAVPTPPASFRTFNPAERGAFEVLAESVTIFHEAQVAAAFGMPKPGESVLDLRPLERLDECIDGLSRTLATAVIDARVPTAALRSAMHEADLAAEPILAALDADREDVLEEYSRDVQADHASGLLRRAALEDRAVNLLTGKSEGAYGFGWEHVDESFADRVLIGYVYDRAEAFMTQGLLSWLEWRACEWYADCWSPTPAAARRAPVFGNRPLQELFLLDRPSIASRRPNLATFLETTPTLATSPRQRRVAEALLDSVPGVFRRITTTGGVATLERVGDGQRFDVEFDGFDEPADPICVGRIFRRANRYAPTFGFDRLGAHLTEPVEALARAIIDAVPPRYPGMLIQGARAAVRGAGVPVFAPGSMSCGESATLIDLIESLVETGELLRPGAHAPWRPSRGGGRPAEPDEMFGLWWATLAGEGRASEENDRSSDPC